MRCKVDAAWWKRRINLYSDPANEFVLDGDCTREEDDEDEEEDNDDDDKEEEEEEEEGVV